MYVVFYKQLLWVLFPIGEEVNRDMIERGKGNSKYTQVKSGKGKKETETTSSLSLQIPHTHCLWHHFTVTPNDVHLLPQHQETNRETGTKQLPPT